MATKKNTTTRTKKGVAFESFDDIDLSKNIDLEAGKEAVQNEPAPKPEPKPKKVTARAKKTTPPKAKKATPVPPKEKEEELIRTTIDFPKSEHRKLKILAMDADMKLYQYLYNIVKEHLDKN